MILEMSIDSGVGWVGLRQNQWWPAKVQQTMLSGLQEIFSGQSTPDKVLSSMDQDYKAGS